MNIEPFGYFKADVCGWTDCAEDDEGAIPLWDSDALCAIEKQRDELLVAAEAAMNIIGEMGPSKPHVRAFVILQDAIANARCAP